MFYYDGERWVAFKKRISYTETVTVYDDFDESYADKENLKVENIELTTEELKRLDIIKDISNLSLDEVESFVKSGESENGFIQSSSLKNEEVKAIKSLISFEKATAEELDALYFLKKEFAHGIFIEKNDLVEYEGGLYIVNQGHIASDIYPPGTAPSLYTVKRKGTGGDGLEPDPWMQPTHAEDAYKIGDRVLYLPDGLIYVSQINGNDTEPTKDEPYNRWWKLDEN